MLACVIYAWVLLHILNTLLNTTGWKSYDSEVLYILVYNVSIKYTQWFGTPCYSLHTTYFIKLPWLSLRQCLYRYLLFIINPWHIIGLKAHYIISDLFFSFSVNEYFLKELSFKSHWFLMFKFLLKKESRNNLLIILNTAAVYLEMISMLLKF